jgi:hypothetical protein
MMPDSASSNKAEGISHKALRVGLLRSRRIAPGYSLGTMAARGPPLRMARWEPAAVRALAPSPGTRTEKSCLLEVK